MRRFLPTLSTLQAFEAAARQLSFTKAADDLGITQSAISRQIKNLEEFLGIQLFERYGSRVVLTDAGQAYAESIHTAIDKLEIASIDIVRGRRAEEALKIGTLPTFGSRWLTWHLDAFSRNLPDEHLEFVRTYNDADFSSTPMDIAILRGDGSWPAAKSYPLFAEMLAVVASPNLIATGEMLDQTDFARYRLLQNASRSSLWLKWLRASDINYRGTLQGPRFDNTGMLINAAIAGYGLAVVPVCLIEKELSDGTLHTPFGAPVPSGESYFVVYPERKAHSIAVKQFRDWLLQMTKQLR